MPALTEKRAPHRPQSFYNSLPKIDLHRHLEGSLRLSTLREVGQNHALNLPSTNRLQELVQVGEGEDYTYQNFLAKFQTIRLFYRSPEIIRRVAYEAVVDAALDNVRYLELRFTPVALARAEHFPLGLVMDWVIAGVRQAESEYGTKTRLIASANRHESPRLAEEVARLAAERQDEGIVGLDLAGDEANFPATPFAGLFREARQSGLHVTVHAGEWGGADNVREAIEQIGAKRIGHGIRVLEDPKVTFLARERGISFEVCVTSNYQSGAVPASNQHPLRRMLALGLDASINTDDPGISNIDLSSEYRLVCEDMDLTPAALFGRIQAAAQAAFLPDTEKKALSAKLTAELPQLA